MNIFERFKNQKNRAVCTVLLFFKRSKLTELRDVVNVNDSPFFGSPGTCVCLHICLSSTYLGLSGILFVAA